jgi:hypothetical protein
LCDELINKLGSNAKWRKSHATPLSISE